MNNEQNLKRRSGKEEENEEEEERDQGWFWRLARL